MAIAAAVIALVQTAWAAPYLPYATTAGEASLAASIDSAQASGSRAAMLASVDALPGAEQRSDAMGQLTPRAYPLLPRLAIQSMDAADGEIRHYLAERRSIAMDVSADVPVRGDRTIHMTLMSGLRQARYDGGIDRTEVRSDSRSLRFAIDVSPVRSLIVGAALGIDGIDARLDPVQRPRITQFNSQIGPYASFNDGRFYADVTATYNFAEYKLRRQLGWTGFSDRVRASADGDGWAASGEAGAMLRAGTVRVQPFAGLQYRHADIGGFREGGGAAALEVASYRTRLMHGILGARVSTNIAVGSWTLRPSAEAQWQREFRKQPDSRIEARFVGGGLPVFTLRPGRLDRDAGLLSASVAATHASRTIFRLGYAGEFAADRRVHAALLSVGRRF